MKTTSGKFKNFSRKIFVEGEDGAVHAASFRVREPQPAFDKGRWQRRAYLYLQYREKKKVKEMYIGRLMFTKKTGVENAKKPI